MYTYILRCNDGTFYTGWTTDIKRRVETHNRGCGSRYTRARLPVECLYMEESATKSEAMRREYQIKQLSRSQKAMLIATFNSNKGLQ